ncbi:MAG: MAPEG family protein [Roseibium sp.]
MQLSEKQSGVMKGMVSAMILALAALSAGAHFLSPIPPVANPASLRITFAVVSLVPVALCLMISIGLLARHRFFTPEDIDGSGLTEGTAQARTLQAVLQNTLEQSVLAALTYGCFAALAPLSVIGAVQAGAVLFIFGRLLFWKGYANGAAARAFGFALTFYPTVLLLIVTGILVISTNTL